jgi:hypothetical protein
MWSWSKSSTTRKERLDRKKAEKAAPPPTVGPFVVPSPRGRVGSYIAANANYADPPVAANPAMQGRFEWFDDGTYPASGEPAFEWSGYRQSNWVESQANEHLINGDEGEFSQEYQRYHSALNPYWRQIPDSRPVRTPHEYDFRRPFDQKNKLGLRNLTGLTYEGSGNLGLTQNPSQSLKGMRPPGRGRTTYRIEPTDLSVDNRIPSENNITLESNDVFSNNSYIL